MHGIARAVRKAWVGIAIIGVATACGQHDSPLAPETRSTERVHRLRSLDGKEHTVSAAVVEWASTNGTPLSIINDNETGGAYWISSDGSRLVAQGVPGINGLIEADMTPETAPAIVDGFYAYEDVPILNMHITNALNAFTPGGGGWQPMAAPMLGGDKLTDAALRSPVLMRRPTARVSAGLSEALSPLTTGDPCYAAGHAISNRRYEVLAPKIALSSKLREEFSKAPMIPGVALEWNASRNAWKIRPEYLQEVLQNVVVKGVELVTSHTTTKVGAALWNLWGCAGVAINVGPYGRNLGGAIGRGGDVWGVYGCWEEYWEISFDGGQTWFPVRVIACGTRDPQMMH